MSCANWSFDVNLAIFCGTIEYLQLTASAVTRTATHSDNGSHIWRDLSNEMDKFKYWQRIYIYLLTRCA